MPSFKCSDTGMAWHLKQGRLPRPGSTKIAKHASEAPGMKTIPPRHDGEGQEGHKEITCVSYHS